MEQCILRRWIYKYGKLIKIIQMEGIHILASFYDCQNKRILINESFLKKELINLVDQSGLEIVGNCFYKFKKGGVTGIVLISESHISVHTWPEKNNSLTLDIYTCNVSQNNENKAKKLYGLLMKLFLPKRIKMRAIRR